MGKLDEVLEVFMDAKKETLVGKVEEEELEEFCSTIRENAKKVIVDEVKRECTNEIISKASEEINRISEKNRIRELKRLMRDGFVIAFF